MEYCYKCGWVKQQCQCEKPMTNADRIRNMSDEELVKFINHESPSCTEFCDKLKCGCLYECPYNRGDDIILQWLQTEVNK